MRQEYDVIRSLARYVALALGEDFMVREVNEEGAVTRPGAIIEMASPEARADASTRQVLEVNAGYDIFVYPSLGKVPLESRAIAGRVAGQLSEAIEGGVDEGQPGLIPLYDYEGVPYDQPSEVRRSQDFARVLDFSVWPKQSPDDELRYTVAAEVRLGWRRDRALPSNARTLQSIRIALSTA